MMVSFIVVWTPYAVESLWAAHVKHVSVTAAVLPTMFAKSSCALNPIIFIASSSNFRRDLAKLWTRTPSGQQVETTHIRDQRSFFVRRTEVQSTSGNTETAAVYYDKERIFIGEMSASNIQKEAGLLHHKDISIASSSRSDMHLVVQERNEMDPSVPGPSRSKSPDMFSAVAGE